MFNNVNEKTHLENNWWEFWIAWNIGSVNYQKIRFLRIIFFYRKPEANWGSSTQAQQFVTTLKNCHTLNEMPEHVKNYRFVPLESIPNNRLLKVSKSQKQFFLKLHCPKNERNITTQLKLGKKFVKYFVPFLGNRESRKNAFEIYWSLVTPRLFRKKKNLTWLIRSILLQIYLLSSVSDPFCFDAIVHGDLLA